MLFNFIDVYILWILLYLLYLFFSPLVGGANKIIIIIAIHSRVTTNTIVELRLSDWSFVTS